MKLVRDRIPEIMKQRGKEPRTTVISPDSLYERLLEAKLLEEVSEYMTTKDLTELADVMEVLHALAARQGCTPEKLEEIRQRKYDERGGFAGRIVLENPH